MAINWQEIKTEYITDPTATYRKLAQKHSVSYQAICHRSKDEGWIALREQHLNETTSKTLDKISQKEANRAAKIYSVADKLLLKIEILADRPGVMPKDIRSLAASVKDLKDILGVKSDLDKQEQKARISNLEKQAEKGAADKSVTVEMSAEVEEFSG